MSTLKTARLEKQIKKLNEALARERMIKELENERLNNHWSAKFDMIVGMFEIQAKEAGTISELRKWFKEWTEDVNGVNASDEDASEYMADLIEKHGFEFEIRPINVTHKEILERY